MTPSLATLIADRDHYWRLMSLPYAELFDLEQSKRAAAEITAEIQRRFPAYAASRRRNAADLTERERLIRAGVSPMGAVA